MNVINVRKHPEYEEQAIAYFQKQWGNRRNKKVYEDCIRHSLTTENPLPVWYLLENEGAIIGCAGLITNDFISRMDLWPWLCALFIDKRYRGQNLAELFMSQIKADVAEMGMDNLYLCTDHKGYYEKYDFDYLADGYHPWGDRSRIYVCNVTK